MHYNWSLGILHCDNTKQNNSCLCLATCKHTVPCGQIADFDTSPGSYGFDATLTFGRTNFIRLAGPGQ